MRTVQKHLRTSELPVPRFAEAQQTTFIIVSHDPMIAEIVDTAYDLHDGRLMLRVRNQELTV